MLTKYESLSGFCHLHTKIVDFAIIIILNTFES